MILMSCRSAHRASLLLSPMRADIDAIQELSDVLLLDEARLVDESCRLGNVLNVHAGKDELILGLTALLHLHTWEALHGAHNLLSEEVAYLSHCAVVCNVNIDGEVRIH